jgi:heptosyltransferase II
MNQGSNNGTDHSPILIVPYLWIGDFVRCHSVVKLLRQRFPDRPIDILASTLCAPLTDYMPGLRQAIVVDLPRKRLALGQQMALAKRLRREAYGTALIMPRTWKSALAPYFAGIPERTGFVGETRFFLLNDLRPGEKRLPRMVDRCAALALPAGAALPLEWPLPELQVPREEIDAWRQKPMPRLPDVFLPRVLRFGCSAGPAKRPSPRKL